MSLDDYLKIQLNELSQKLFDKEIELNKKGFYLNYDKWTENHIDDNKTLGFIQIVIGIDNRHIDYEILSFEYIINTNECLYNDILEELNRILRDIDFILSKGKRAFKKIERRKRYEAISRVRNLRFPLNIIVYLGVARSIILIVAIGFLLGIVAVALEYLI